MRILVTGCCGFIGYHFCKRILDIGHTVVGIDNMNNYYDVSMKWKRLDEIKSFDKFTFFENDICNNNFLISVFKDN